MGVRQGRGDDESLHGGLVQDRRLDVMELLVSQEVADLEIHAGIDAPHLVAALQVAFREMGADETAAAGDENLHSILRVSSPAPGPPVRTAARGIRSAPYD